MNNPVLVTLLTGRRPHLLDRTLAAVAAFQPELLDLHWLIVHNGGDADTAAVLRNSGAGNVVTTANWLDIGAATSLLFGLVPEFEPEYVLHLEDDWEASPGSWLPQAEILLGSVFQVRLRTASEPVRAVHMVTGRRIVWHPAGRARTSTDAHYTLNPSLIRGNDLHIGWPADSEREAQRKFHRAKRRKVAQLIPGIWSHTGGGESLHR